MISGIGIFALVGERGGPQGGISRTITTSGNARKQAEARMMAKYRETAGV
jgi:hypothetical protein